MKRIIIIFSILAILAIACGQVTTLPTATAAKSLPIATQRPTGTPQATEAPSLVVCPLVTVLNVRAAAGTGEEVTGEMTAGDAVETDGILHIAPDMGTWYELDGGGFVNADYICESQ